MKKLLLFSLLLTLAVGFNACKKDDDTKPDDNSGNNEPKEQIIEIKTSFGDMYMWLYKETPQHRDNFLKITKDGTLTNTTFHRIIKDFVIQGGDPATKNESPLNYTIPAEFVTALKHEYGAVGAARTQNPQKASSSTQFYVVVNKNGTPHLDGDYTVFGKIIKGMDVATTISTQPKDGSDKPTTDIKMEVNIVEKTLAELETEFGFTP